MKITLTVLLVVTTLALFTDSQELRPHHGGRLVNSLWANENQFPYQVAIRAESAAGGSLRLCSGALINANFVITSARCVLRNQVFHMRFSTVTHYTGGITQTSHDARIHPLYNPQNNTNDVALIRLSTAIHQNAVPPVQLPNVSNPRESLGDLNGRVAILSAWGRDLSGDFSPVLQYTWTQINNATTPACRELWQQQGQGQQQGRIPDQSILCATDISGRRQVNRFCSGDNGSPLVIQNNRAFILVGLGVSNSFDEHCPNATTLFTSIIAIREWIRREASV